MCYLDSVDSGRVERGGDRRASLGGELVASSVHAITQRDIMDVEPHCAAIRSPTRTAAEVMMSRLPAYAGR
jgi:hypothetical protein